MRSVNKDLSSFGVETDENSSLESVKLMPESVVVVVGGVVFGCSAAVSIFSGRTAVTEVRAPDFWRRRLRRSFGRTLRPVMINDR